CLEVGGDKLKGTCLFFADRPGSLDRMTALIKKHEGRIVAARIHAYAPDRLPPFGKPELRSLETRRGSGTGRPTPLRAPLRPRLRAADQGILPDHGDRRPLGATLPGYTRGIRGRARMGEAPQYGHEALVAPGEGPVSASGRGAGH